MDAVAAVLISLVTLHRLDGGEVVVNPRNVTSLHSPRPPSAAKLLRPEGHCAIWMADGRLVSVLEPCSIVKRLLEEAQQ